MVRTNSLLGFGDKGDFRGIWLIQAWGVSVSDPRISVGSRAGELGVDWPCIELRGFGDPGEHLDPGEAHS